MASRKSRQPKTETRRVTSAREPRPERKEVRVDPLQMGHTSQRVRIAGTLGPVDPVDHSFTLVLEPDEALCGSAEILPLEPLNRLVGKTVMVYGIGRFRRSGSLLRIDAEGIELAQGDVSFWSRIPRPIFSDRKTPASSALKPGSSWTSVIGQWPGTESDEEVLAALEELS